MKKLFVVFALLLSACAGTGPQANNDPVQDGGTGFSGGPTLTAAAVVTGVGLCIWLCHGDGTSGHSTSGTAGTTGTK